MKEKPSVNMDVLPDFDKVSVYDFLKLRGFALDHEINDYDENVVILDSGAPHPNKEEKNA